MFYINPIGYNEGKYHIKKDNKIQPVSKANISDNRNNNGSNSSDFKEILEAEIKKQKKKKLIREE